MEKEISGYSHPKNNEISLKEVILKLSEWFYYLLSKWISILFVGLIVALLGLAYAYYKKPVYVATTTFVLEEAGKSGGLGQYAGIASMVGVDLGGMGGGGGGIFDGDNILELYKSRTMIRKTLLTMVDQDGKKVLLLNRYIDYNGLRKRWEEKPELKNISFTADTDGVSAPVFTRLQDSVLNVITTDINKENLSVLKPDQKLGIIKAEVKSPDEFFAKNFNEQIVKHVTDFYVQTKTKKSLINVSILQGKTDSVRRVMNGAIYSAAVVADATPNLNVTRQIQRTVPVQRSQFSVETNKAILSELVKNLELAKISLLKETPLIQVIDEPIFPLEKLRFGKLKGMVVGGFLGCFLAVLVLLGKRMIKEILE